MIMHKKSQPLFRIIQVISYSNLLLGCNLLGELIMNLRSKLISQSTTMSQVDLRTIPRTINGKSANTIRKIREKHSGILHFNISVFDITGVD